MHVLEDQNYIDNLASVLWEEETIKIITIKIIILSKTTLQKITLLLQQSRKYIIFTVRPCYEFSK